MKLYFQLYSARFTPLDEALAIIAECGYSGVEAYRDNFTDSNALKAGLQKHGLSLPSMHVNLNSLRDDFAACAEQAEDFNCKHIVCPYLEADERPTDTLGWQSLGHELGEIEARLANKNFTFAWHNHDFEFAPLPDGTKPIEHLLDAAISMSWEVDVAWIVRAGASPAPWIERYQSRLSAVHLKDIAQSGQCLEEDGWADFGHGVVAWKTLLPILLTSSASLYVAEHDKPADLQRFASRSFDAAKAMIP